MSSTLSELAKTRQTTTVGAAQSGAVGSAGATNIRPTLVTPSKQIDNTAGLIKDIGKLFGKGVEAHVEASEYTGKRVGTDNLVQYKKDMGAIALHYANKADISSADMVEKTRLEQGVYESYMQKGAFGDNEIANEAFRNTYAVPATDNLFDLKQSNAKNRVKLFRGETKRDVSEAIKYLGTDITNDNIDTFKSMYSEANISPDEIDVLVVGELNDILSVKVNTNKENYYDAGGTIDEEAMDASLREIYKLYAGTTNDTISAIIEKNIKSGKAYIRQQANNEKNKYVSQAMNIGRSMTWDGKPYTDENGVRYFFAPDYATYEQSIKENAPLLNTEDHTQVMNLYRKQKNASSSTVATKWYEFNAKKFEEANKNGDVFNPVDWTNVEQWGNQLISSDMLSDKEKVKMKSRIEDINRNQNRTIRIREEINNITVADAKKRINKGGEIDGWSVSGDTYRKQYEKLMAGYEDDASSVDIMADGGQAAFGSSLAQVDRMSNILNKQSPLFTQYEKNFNYVGGGTKSLGEIEQTLAYYEYARANGDESMNHYEPHITQLKQIIGNTELEPKVRATRANAYLQDIAINVTSKKNDKQTLGFFNAAVKGVAEGEGLLFTTINTPVPTNTDQHMLNVYTGQRDEAAIADHVQGYEYYDSGVGGFDEYRVAIPKALSKRQFGNYVDAIVNQYNGGESVLGIGDKIDADDLYYEVGDDGKDLTYRLNITVNGRVRHIGNINSKGYQLVKGRQ